MRPGRHSPVSVRLFLTLAADYGQTHVIWAGVTEGRLTSGLCSEPFVRNEKAALTDLLGPPKVPTEAVAPALPFLQRVLGLFDLLF